VREERRPTIIAATLELISRLAGPWGVGIPQLNQKNKKGMRRKEKVLNFDGGKTPPPKHPTQSTRHASLQEVVANVEPIQEAKPLANHSCGLKRGGSGKNGKGSGECQGKDMLKGRSGMKVANSKREERVRMGENVHFSNQPVRVRNLDKMAD